MAAEEDLDRTTRETQRILKSFEELQQEYQQKVAESQELARQLGASSFEELVQAATKDLSPQEKEYMEKEQAAFQEELERDLREIEERARREKAPGAAPAGFRPRRFGRTV